MCENSYSEDVLTILRKRVGRSKALTGRVIARLLDGRNHSDDRMVRLAISELRERDDLNVVIVSGNEGFWIAESQEECDRCIARLSAKATSLLAVVRAMERGARRVYGPGKQLGLEL